jgi:GPH family glycoside/pentoside/hexuronide:cation symporter
MSKKSSSFKEKFLFGISAIPDQLTYQVFQLLVFTYYFTVIRLPMTYIVIAYILWGVWNAVNDPLIGALSEKRKYKKRLGKRRFYIIIAIFPLSLIMFFLFYMPFETTNNVVKFIYFLTIIFLFELFYSMFNVNMNAIFPDQFATTEERASTQIFRNVSLVFALILGALLPGLIISDFIPNNEAAIAQIKSEYIILGLVVAILTFVVAVPFVLWGIKEKEETLEDLKKRPSLLQAFKKTLTNKAFLKFTLANTMIWYCYSMLPLILPIYAEYVLDIPEGALLISLSLMSTFIVAAISMPIHRKIGFKIGVRNGMILSLSLWIISLIPYFLITGEQFLIVFMVNTALLGFPLAGAIFYTDLLHSDVIDYDALTFGFRRGANFYGIHLFIQRLAIILEIITVWAMFRTIGWEKEFIPVPEDPALVILGLKSLMFIFPAIALVIAILLMISYSLHGEKLKQMREDLKKYPDLN